MINIRNNKIIMTRGDTLRVVVDIFNDDGTPYEPIEGDSIRFAVKSSYNAKDVLIYKDIPLDTRLLELNPADTKNFKQPSDYVYDIQLTHANGDIDTFIANQVLQIKEEVD